MSDDWFLRELHVRADRFGAFVWRDGVRWREGEGRAPYVDDAELRGTGCESWMLEKDKRRPVTGVLGEHAVRFCAVEWHAVLYVDGRLWVWEDLGTVERDAGGFVSGYDIEATVFDARRRRYRMRAATDWMGEGTVTMVLVEPDGTVWRSVAGWGTGAGHQDDERAQEPAFNLRSGMPVRDEEEDAPMALHGKTHDGLYAVLEGWGCTMYPADGVSAVATYPLTERIPQDCDTDATPEIQWSGMPGVAPSSDAHASARAWVEQKKRDLAAEARRPGTDLTR